MPPPGSSLTRTHLQSGASSDGGFSCSHAVSLLNALRHPYSFALTLGSRPPDTQRTEARRHLFHCEAFAQRMLESLHIAGDLTWSERLGLDMALQRTGTAALTFVDNDLGLFGEQVDAQRIEMVRTWTETLNVWREDVRRRSPDTPLVEKPDHVRSAPGGAEEGCGFSGAEATPPSPSVGRETFDDAVVGFLDSSTSEHTTVPTSATDSDEAADD